MELERFRGCIFVQITEEEDSEKMLKILLEARRELECSIFRLSTPKFAHAAQHIYRSFGFVEREGYPESEVPVAYKQYWIFMEKTE